MTNILTIDVEDWYTSTIDLFREREAKHGMPPDGSVVTNTRRALRLLARHGHTATFFVLGTVAEHYPDLVREIGDAGHEVAAHGYLHKLVYRMSPAEFEEDVTRCQELIDATGCSGPYGYRAPYWSITKRSLWAIDVLKRCGIAYDSSIFPIARRLYGMPKAPRRPHRMGQGLSGQPFWEIPPSTVRLLGLNIPIAGGGYLRTLPYPLVRWAVRALNRRGERAVIYFHPYELDACAVELRHKAQTVGTRVVRATQRVGLAATAAKLERLLTDFSFGSVTSALAASGTTLGRRDGSR